MAKITVVDSSAALAWGLPDEHHPAAEAMFGSLFRREERGCVPVLWRWEVTNGLLLAQRRKRMDALDVEDMLDALLQLPLELDASPDRHRTEQTLRLAQAHALTVYNAAYLELVLRLNGQLFSFDRALVRAAKSCGIACIDTTPANI
jgi:predicted nucleic acid-binding protein